ncbi:MAG: DUF4054 domain-containing protein [Terriglobales bacterium]
MAVTPAIVKGYAPEFAAADDALVAFYITDAASYIGAVEFGANSDLAVKLFTCHCLAMGDAGRDSFAGDISSQRVGEAARSWQSTSTFAEDLLKTAHGQGLVRLMRALTGPAAFCV